MRIADPGYTGSATTPEEYLIESILLADECIILGEWEESMGTMFGYNLTVQDPADVLEWMTSGETTAAP